MGVYTMFLKYPKNSWCINVKDTDYNITMICDITYKYNNFTAKPTLSFHNITI